MTTICTAQEGISIMPSQGKSVHESVDSSVTQTLPSLSVGEKVSVWSLLEKKILEMKRNKQVDTLLVGSTYMRRELERNGFNSKKIKLLPPCVQSFPQKLQNLPEQPSILFVGQLIKGKGVDVLLKAYDILCKKSTLQIPLHIIGRGNEEAELKQFVQKTSYASLVHFHGWVAHDELAQYYDSFHCSGNPLSLA